MATATTTGSMDRRPYGLLLAMLGAQLILGAVLPRASWAGWINTLLVIGVLVAGGWAASEGRRWRLGLLVLALGTSAALLGARGVASDALRLAALGLGAGLLVFVAGAILRDVLRTRDVTPTTLAGASSVYLLLGTAFGVAFLTLESVAPGSFHEGGAAPVTEGWNAYLSLVTLSTLGYGDVVPVTRTARALAATEALLGQLYLTILVARLVGLQLGGARGESRAGP